MGISCIVDSIADKMGLVSEKNVTNRMGLTINPTVQFQTATHVRRFKMLKALDGLIVAVHRIGQHGHRIRTR